MKRLLIGMIMMSVLPRSAGAGLFSGDYSLIYPPATVNADNTALTGTVTYKAVCSRDPVMLDNVWAAVKTPLPTADPSKPEWNFNTDTYGWQDLDTVYFSATVCWSNENCSNCCSDWGPVISWDVGQVDANAPMGVILRRINPAELPDTFVVSVPPQTYPSAGLKVYFSDVSWRSVFQGAVQDFGNKANQCLTFSPSTKAFYGAVVSYDDTGKISGFNKLIFYKRGAVKCTDPKTCRVDGVHSAFPFGLHIGKYPEPLPGLSVCDSNLPLVPLTDEQQEIQNASFTGGLRIGPQDAFLLGLYYTEATN
jgi:hypothetical protein